MAEANLVGRMSPELELLLPLLDERARRLVLGAVARAAGEGGTAAVAAATGASWQTVANGAAELASGDSAPPGRVRRPGAGRKKLADQDPGLVPGLRALLEESTRGDPCSPLLWTTLVGAGHRGRADRAGAPVRQERSPRGTAGGGVQPAGQLPDHRGEAASGPGRPVPVYQRAGEGVPGGRGSGDQRGHQEEGAGRAVRQLRPVLAARGGSGAGPRP